MPEKQEIHKHIINNKLSIIVKPNSSSNEIIGWNEQKNALRVNIAAPADKDKANKEIIKFFTKTLKKTVRIKTGLRSKEKLLEIN